MLIFPAIDLYGGKAVRLLRGDYAQMTVYNEHPEAVAKEFERLGATCIHLVDLEGAKEGTTPHMEVVRKIAEETSLFCEIGGGIRSLKTIEKYLAAGVKRVILGTVAVEDPDFVKKAVELYGDAIAVGADIRDGRVSIKGWTEDSQYTLDEFCEKMQENGVKTLICTDISRDGAMIGTNRTLYKDLSEKFSMNIVASGGVSTMEDVEALTKLGIYGVIIGKAYYTGAIDLKEALEVAHKC
ncbi:MAG: 1-(5-phosphoribosyl)-5-[Christensenellaceae bacterium]|nr:1-(5-phosphoribosyl)-5-[(5-phosphoribosylamino)methylideneamino]imidazole-4-carboxamide isomerase [Christensenellaceae bacterium]